MIRIWGSLVMKMSVFVMVKEKMRRRYKHEIMKEK